MSEESKIKQIAGGIMILIALLLITVCLFNGKYYTELEKNIELRTTLTE